MLQEQLLRQIDVLCILSPTCLVSEDWIAWKENHDQNKDALIEGKLYPIQLYKYTEDNGQSFVSIIQEIRASQQSILELHPRDELPRVLVILDDCVGLPVLRQNGILDRFSTSCRHYNVSFIVLAQKIAACPRTYRVNSKYNLIFSISNFSEAERYMAECLPQNFKKEFKNRLIDIFNTKYNFVLCNSFATQIRDRLYLNGETPIEFANYNPVS